MRESKCHSTDLVPLRPVKFFRTPSRTSVLVPLLTNLLVSLSRTYIEEAEPENSFIDISENETEIKIE